MKSCKVITGIILLACMLGGCGRTRQSFSFPSQGVEVSLSCNQTWYMRAGDDLSKAVIHIWDSENLEEIYGSIDIFRTDKNSLDEMTDVFSGGLDDFEEITPQLRFRISSYTLRDGLPRKSYAFLFLDSTVGVAVAGRWYVTDPCKPEDVLELAKSIQISAIEQVPPCTDEVAGMEKPTTRMASTEETVTDV